MYKDSMNAKNWYFFCATGLNITQKILMLVCEEHAFDVFILSNLELFEQNHQRMEQERQESENGDKEESSDTEEDEKSDSLKNRKDNKNSKKQWNSEYHQIKQQLRDEELFSKSMLFDFFLYLYFTLFKMLNDRWVKEKPNIMEFT